MDRDESQPKSRSTSADRRPGGLVHTYLGYDPAKFPSPTAPPPDMASAAFDHMLRFGSSRRLTPDELADAIEIDPSQIAGLGPSLDALIEMLEERKRKILETYETRHARALADRAWRNTSNELDPPSELGRDYVAAVATQSIRELRRLWYEAARTREGETSPFAIGLLGLMERLGERYQVEQLASKYDFTGREKMDVEKALEIKEELEAIDELLEQLKEAMKNAKIGVIDMEALQRFADEAGVEKLRELQQQVQDMLQEEARRQGLDDDGQGGVRLTPKAYKIFQAKLLAEIFSNLQAARSGRHQGPIEGEGAVEMPSTRQYEFGDSAAHMDIPQSFINAMLRAPERGRFELRPDDIEIHRTRNNPKCATAVIMDMSGSMRYGGQYIQCKRMALALDGLIRREYPGDFLRFIEMYSVARVVPRGEVVDLLPKPVTIHDPVVRLRADMSDPGVSEAMLPPHFTNIQHSLRLSRQLLASQDTPNKQIVLITDGLPTAHFNSEQLYLLYPPDPMTEEATIREALACKRAGITINMFVIPSWSQSSEDIAFAHALAEPTNGRVFFTQGDDLDQFVLWDYVSRRRRLIG